MPGQIQQLADQLWRFEGGFVADHWGLPEAANAVLYQREDRLYLLDSGLGAEMRAAIEQQLMATGHVRSFTLLNSSAGLGQTGNNDLIHNVLAEEKLHYAAVPAALAAAPERLAAQLYALSRYVDPFHSLDGHGLRQWGLRLAREALAAFIGQQKALQLLVRLAARRWPEVSSSAQTARALPAEEWQPVEPGGVAWQAWRLGGDDVWVLPVGDVWWFYLPAVKTLFAPHWQDAFFPAWPEEDGSCPAWPWEQALALVQSGAVEVLIDGQNVEAIREGGTARRIVEQLTARRQGLQQALEAILKRDPGSSVRKISRQVRKLGHRPAVAWYLDAPLPVGLVGFEQVLVCQLLEMGCQAKGVWRHKRMYLV